MHRSARDSAATKTLLGHVGDRATGKLAVGAGAAEVAVYLLNGSLVSATAADDLVQMVRMLGLHDALDDRQVRAFEARISKGESPLGEILEVDATAVDRVLWGRFQQNLCEFLASGINPVFYEQRTVFVDNIQMGHDTATLIDEMCVRCDQAKLLDVQAQLVQGDSTPSEDAGHLTITEALDPAHPTTPAVLLHELPLEAFEARAALVELLALGVAQRVDHRGGLDDIDFHGGAHSSDDALTIGAIGEERGTGNEPTLADPPTQPLAGVEEFPGTDAMDNIEDIEDEPTQQVDRPTSGENGVDLSWMTDDVAADELDVFSDHDYDRGAGDDGAFSTAEHNLDKIDVAGLDAPSDVIEALEAPSARYGAPMLSETEASDKLEVANGVLTAVVKAFDNAEGSGRGRAVVQLLVDGGPARYSALLQNLQVREDGALPGEMLMRNLYSRPATEHRQLLNSSLVDIIERALSSAADELPDDAFDSVFESIAGYRQRLGL